MHGGTALCNVVSSKRVSAIITYNVPNAPMHSILQKHNETTRRVSVMSDQQAYESATIQYALMHLLKSVSAVHA